MKKKYYLVALLLMLVGFAAVSTTLYINGSAKIKANKDDFHVYYSNALVDGEQDLSVITDDTHISFTTEFSELGEIYELEYEVTNGSKNYDAELEMVCISGNEYLSVTNEFDDENILESLDTRNGILTLELVKSYTGDDFEVSIECTLSANAQERDSLGIGEVEIDETPLKFRTPYVLYEEANGETIEVVTVFYEEGLVTSFANGDHGQDVVYPVAEAVYEGNTIKISPIGVETDEYQEYTVSDNGDTVSTIVYVTSSEGDYEYTQTSYLTDLNNLTYDIPIDIDLNTRVVSPSVWFNINSRCYEEIVNPETDERINYQENEIQYYPILYSEEFDMLLNYYYPNQEIGGIVKIYFDKNGLELLEKDDIGHWDDYVWTFKPEDFEKSSGTVKSKFVDYDNVSSGVGFETSVGLILFES